MRITIQLLASALAASIAISAAAQQVAPVMPQPAMPMPSAQDAKPAMAPGQSGPEPTTVVPLPIRAPRPALDPTPTMGESAVGVQPVSVSAGPFTETENVQRLLAFRDSEVKFEIGELMRILRDSRHEGWVLAAYPDPKTGHPLIGAGFTLDLPARAHPQTDPTNPHPFMEPSSAELWQAAGLPPVRLRGILAQFDTRLAAWNKKGFRRKMTALAPQISDEDASLLMRVAIIQAAYNAKGYCRDFDRLAASQQMALTQLVYQMGYNLQQFTTFLTLINNYASGQAAPGTDQPVAPAAPMETDFATDSGYWRTVQQSLVTSQWARLYRARAVAVIAMLDPHYGEAPNAAETRVSALLRPAVVHKTRHGSVATRRAAGKTPHARAARQHKHRA